MADTEEVNRIPSPSNAFSPEIPPMRAPHVEFVYRLQAKMGPVRYSMTKLHASQISRNVAHVSSGTMKGPKISGNITERSGADWSQQVVTNTSKMFARQDDVEYSSHLTFETGEGPYNWMNSVVATGCMASVNGELIVDCWRLTNFPGVEAEEVVVKQVEVQQEK
ncbi:hypothetical protein L207DRAFT_532041 [Hyaloscypha variabilis F]|uniref:Uncharacterized protein n=1 Tax=Hyaloscypha variabilis (strain UAMH 11265 / GT02V1 / F) TaxID=1149755 RepID=A0A2J6RGZ8_HYAVF|nr:hypothetical protein L207DRAFT_532041 [Hyaloscypha variabilis F]